MTGQSKDSTEKRIRRRGVLGWCAANVHFLIATVLLLCVAAGIHAFRRVDRQPVPWPEGTSVGSDFRLLTFPERLGPFKLVDGGEITFDEDIMRALGLGSSYDKDRHPLRRSNWYINRVYEDTRVSDRNNPYRYWRLEVYYYTGMRDNVPHVPERCLIAGGVEVLDRTNVSFNIPAARAGWDDAVKFRRVHYRRRSAGGFAARDGAEYYTFSLNGVPETRWERVRLDLSLPWVRHCFFAKIQFAPFAPSGAGGIKSAAEADLEAEKFMNVFLPAVLRVLPTHSDVERLDAEGHGAPN